MFYIHSLRKMFHCICGKSLNWPFLSTFNSCLMPAPQREFSQSFVNHRNSLGLFHMLIWLIHTSAKSFYNSHKIGKIRLSD